MLGRALTAYLKSAFADAQAVWDVEDVRIAHGIPADGFPNPIPIKLRAKYRQP